MPNTKNVKYVQMMLRIRSAPGQGVVDAKVDGVDEQVWREEEQVGTAEASQQMVENVPHWPRIDLYFFRPY